MKKNIRTVLGAVALCLVTAIVTYQIAVVTTAKKQYREDVTTDAVKSTSDYTDDTFLTDALLKRLRELADVYGKYYVDEIDPDYLSDVLCSAFVYGVEDEFGTYYNAESYASALSDFKGEYYGIGITVFYDNAQLEIVRISADSPAEKAGLRCGDRIVSVAGEAVSDLGYLGAVDKMRGEKGTAAVFTVLRDGVTIDFSVVRDKVSEVTVEYYAYKGQSDIAVIRINSFDGTTVEQFQKCISAALLDGAKGFVFDVRDNLGGSLDAICTILDFLLPEGPIIRIDCKGTENDTEIRSGASFFDYPMVVLCNGYTASAGELFCSALKDYKVAKLIGTQTYGKGTMQQTLSLPSGGGISVTVAYYLPPFSDNYHGVGITPDVIVELPEEAKNKNLYKLTAEEDTQMQAAVVTLLEEMNEREHPSGSLT